MTRLGARVSPMEVLQYYTEQRIRMNCVINAPNLIFNFHENIEASSDIMQTQKQPECRAYKLNKRPQKYDGGQNFMRHLIVLLDFSLLKKACKSPGRITVNTFDPFTFNSFHTW